MGDILLLEEIASGAQGSVQIGYIQSKKQMVAIKRMNRKDEYEFEKAAYVYLASNNLAGLSMRLIDSDDKNQLLIIERGGCDLDTFVRLRA